MRINQDKNVNEMNGSDETHCQKHTLYITGVAKPALCMSHISKNRCYEEPQHKNIKTRIYLQSTLL